MNASDPIEEQRLGDLLLHTTKLHLRCRWAAAIEQYHLADPGEVIVEPEDLYRGRAAETVAHDCDIL